MVLSAWFVARFCTAPQSVLQLLCSRFYSAWVAAIPRKAPRSQANAISTHATLPPIRYECIIAVSFSFLFPFLFLLYYFFSHSCIFQSRRKHFHGGTLGKMLLDFNFISISLKPERQIIIRTFLLAYRSNIQTFTYLFLIWFSVLKPANLCSWISRRLLTPHIPTSCNCICVSTGLLLFRDNLRKNLGLSAPVVSCNAR